MVDPLAVLTGALFGPPAAGTRHFDVERMAYLVAALRSAEFFIDNFPMAPNLRKAPALRLHAAREAKLVGGLNCEFGVATGRSITAIAGELKDVVHGFDSFEGLPEDWTFFQKAGRYTREGKPPEGLPDSVKLHIGWFDETLPGFVEAHPGPIRFLHVDSDLYSSAKTIFKFLGERIVPGSVILFDEYFNYPGWELHEHKAWTELVEERRIKFEYIGWASSVCSVAMRVTAVG